VLLSLIGPAHFNTRHGFSFRAPCDGLFTTAAPECSADRRENHAKAKDAAKSAISQTVNGFLKIL
jgi:hypothetical protein